MKGFIRNLFFSALCVVAPLAMSLEFPLPLAGDSMVGSVKTVVTTKKMTLAEIGAIYNLGYAEMVAANSDLSATKNLSIGTHVLIPAQFILPTVRTGLVINLAELRVYYFPVDQAVVYTFPVAAGKKGWVTPLAVTFVERKAANPTWTPPPSIVAEGIRSGKPVKSFYASDDPENPLGDYALYFNVPGIRMHGTLASRSIGRRASHGCVRLWDNDIELLYNQVPVGTPVVIDHSEAMVGWQNHVLYLKVTSPFTEYHDENSTAEAIALAIKDHPATVDWSLVQEAVDNQDGIPVAIGFDAEGQMTESGH